MLGGDRKLWVEVNDGDQQLAIAKSKLRLMVIIRWRSQIVENGSKRVKFNKS